MANIKLEIDGSETVSTAAKSARRGVDDLGAATATAGEKAKTSASGFDNLGKAVAALGAAFAASKVLDFFRESTRAFMEQEKADALLSNSLRQLGYDAKALTPILQGQAAAFQSAFGVSDDMIQKMQRLMISFGVAPNDIKKTTQAILDYSAATGEDAVSATEKVVRGINGQERALKTMGVEVDKSKSSTEKLSDVVGQLEGRFGGAAKAASETLGGQMAKTAQSMDTLKESFGGFVAAIDAKYQVFRSLAESLNFVTFALGGDEKRSKLATISNQAAEIRPEIERLGEILQKLHAQGLGPGNRVVDEYSGKLATLEARMKSLQSQASAIRGEGQVALPGQSATAKALRPESGGPTETTGTVAVVKSNRELLLQAYKEVGVDASDHYKEMADIEKAYQKESDALFDDFVKQRSEANVEAGQIMADEAEKQRQTLLAQESRFQSAGVAVGTAFAGALVSQIKRMRSGEDMDIGEMIISLLPTILSAAALASGVGAPAAAGIGMAGSIFSALMAHEGRWIGQQPLRFHTGGEVPALLQTGERVLSRAEVANMGGPRGVERAVVGRGGGNTYVISAMDAQSFADYMGGRGGGGMTRAIKEGRGEVSQILRRAGVRA